jgi:hypothetical protein
MKFVLLQLLTAIEPGAPGFSEFLTQLAQAEAAQRASEKVHAVLVLHSRGGYIDLGRLIGHSLRNLQATCLVSRANSAALQGVLPGCARIVLAKDSELIFHAATTVLPEGMMLSGAEFHVLTKRSLELSEGMAADVRAGFGPSDKGWCKVVRTKWADLPGKPSCEVLHMFETTRVPGDKFTTLFPTARARVQVVPTREAFLPKGFDANARK